MELGSEGSHAPTLTLWACLHLAEHGYDEALCNLHLLMAPTDDQARGVRADVQLGTAHSLKGKGWMGRGINMQRVGGEGRGQVGVGKGAGGGGRQGRCGVVERVSRQGRQVGGWGGGAGRAGVVWVERVSRQGRHVGGEGEQAGQVWCGWRGSAGGAGMWVGRGSRQVWCGVGGEGPEAPLYLPPPRKHPYTCRLYKCGLMQSTTC